jgi:perosamine synthetase
MPYLSVARSRTRTLAQFLQVRLFHPMVHPSAIEASADVMRSGWIGMGPRVAAFEQAFARYLSLPDDMTAVAVDSCTSALHLALVLLKLPPGSEVVTTAMTFVATNKGILWEGLTPVFADVNPATGNISPASVAEKITPRTGAIMIVHFAGEPCDLDGLKRVAAERSIPIIEDAAHACGAWHGEHPIGASGNLVAFSFGATKALTTIDGGMLILPARMADEARQRRALGQSSDIYRRVNATDDTAHRKAWDYDVDRDGWRYHMSDVNAAIGIAHLPLLGQTNRRRARIAAVYDHLLADIPGIQLLKRNNANRSAHYLYVIQAERRDELAKALQSRGVTVGVHYKPNTHFAIFQPADLPATEHFYARTLSLPIHPELSLEQVHHVCGVIRELGGSW